MASVARKLGQPFMPWQRQVVDVGLEYEVRGGQVVPSYRELVVTIPRQNGKTTLVLAMEVQRALGWDTPQRIAYTAQTGWDARKKLIDDQGPVLMRSPLAATVKQILRGAGNEGVKFENGSSIDVLASTEAAGHGRTFDLAVLDEVFADTDNRREQAILPTMATRRSAQMAVVSTAGTDASLYLRSKVDAGRDAVNSGRRSGIAYFEWSAPDDADPYDVATWVGCMPALGYTIDLAVVEHAAASMSEGEFRRAFLNQWTASDERVIPKAVWDAACGEFLPEGERWFALDVTPDRDAAAIGVAWGDGKFGGIADSRPGTGWVVEAAAQMCRERNAVLALQDSGPAGSLIPDLERAGVPLRRLTAGDHAKACGEFYDALADSRLLIRRDVELDSAVAGVQRRSSGDAWVWARRDATVNVAPLVALTLAVWVAKEPRVHTMSPFVALGEFDDDAD